MKSYKKNGHYINRRKIQIIRRRLAVSFLILLASFVLGFSCTNMMTNAETIDDTHYYKYYTSIIVEKGDTLYSIAEEHFMNYSSIEEYVAEVAVINHLVDDKIIEGASLIIPYFSTELK